MDKSVPLILATTNGIKIGEIKDYFKGSNIEIYSIIEEGYRDFDPEETGNTYKENALIKARAAWNMIGGGLVLADDTGLEIEALNNEPGLYSARYLGEDTSYSAKCSHLLHRMEGQNNRNARIVCSMALITPDGVECTTEETVEGTIVTEISDNVIYVYSYYFILYMAKYGMTLGEMNPYLLNRINSRGKCLYNMEELILSYAKKREE